MMDSGTFNPNWAIAPGNTIYDLLVDKGISREIFAKRINTSTDFVDRLITGKESISEDLSFKLSRLLGGSSTFWRNRELQYQQSIEALKCSSEVWVNSLPIKDMIKFGWIQDVKDKFTECLNFFGVKTVQEWQNRYENLQSNVAFRTSPTFSSDLMAVSAWIRKGEMISENYQSNNWDSESFESALHRIKPLTRKKTPKDFLPELIRTCAECGVIVAVVPTPKGCSASGATKFVSEKKALLLLSFRHLSDDHFWFTFFHEAGHLIMHGNKITFVEGLQAEKDQEEEEEANLFSSEVLIPHEMQPTLYTLKSDTKKIVSFASQAGVSPGIVVGQMQHRGIIAFSYLNSFKRRYNWNDINDVINYPPKYL